MQILGHAEWNDLNIYSGPTSFAPLIRRAIDIVRVEQGLHVLLIVCDGQVSAGLPEKETIDAIVDASEVSLSIVCVGVGDGPWHVMKEFDDRLPSRRFDNFQVRCW